MMNDLQKRHELVEAFGRIHDALKVVSAHKNVLTAGIGNDADQINAAGEIVDIINDIAKKVGILQLCNGDTREGNVLDLLGVECEKKVDDFREVCGQCHLPIDGTDRRKNAYPEGIECDDCSAKWAAEMADFESDFDTREKCELCQKPVNDTNSELYSYGDDLLCDECIKVKTQEAAEEEAYSAQKRKAKR